MSGPEKFVLFMLFCAGSIVSLLLGAALARDTAETRCAEYHAKTMLIADARALCKEILK